MSARPGARPEPPDDPGRVLEERLAAARAILRSFGEVRVAYSGGVDSALLLALAVECLGERATGVIARSESLAERELAAALETAAAMGARVRVVETRELENENYAANGPDRCYHCKAELFDRMRRLAAAEGVALVYGAIADDLGDDRPGMRAALERNVRAPLLEAGFRKAEVREAARRLGLAVWEKPAQPCLASRIPHGLRVTPEKLRAVAAAEEVVRREGFRVVRVRHRGALAGIEVLCEDLPRLEEPERWLRIQTGIRALGFREVEASPGGYRQGGRGATPEDSRPAPVAHGPSEGGRREP
jgi:uncharacterized protein